MWPSFKLELGTQPCELTGFGTNHWAGTAMIGKKYSQHAKQGRKSWCNGMIVRFPTGVGTTASSKAAPVARVVLPRAQCMWPW